MSTPAVDHICYIEEKTTDCIIQSVEYLNSIAGELWHVNSERERERERLLTCVAVSSHVEMNRDVVECLLEFVDVVLSQCQSHATDAHYLHHLPYNVEWTLLYPVYTMLQCVLCTALYALTYIPTQPRIASYVYTHRKHVVCIHYYHRTLS